MERGSQNASNRPIRIGVSACLVGQKVRYDGGHKQDRYLTDTLGRFFEFVPLCPEVELGLSVPRPAMRLEQRAAGVRLVVPQEDRDLTSRMRTYAKSRAGALVEEDVSGCILKSKSPSCGLRTRTFMPEGGKTNPSPGLFAQVLLEQCPHLPVIEEGPLHALARRENWIERVFAYRRLLDFWSGRWAFGDLVEFHIANKLVLLSHSRTAYEEIGRMLAESKSMPRKALRGIYESKFMTALAQPATRSRLVAVLRRVFTVFRKDLDRASRREVLDRIDDYRHGLVPLLVPWSVIRHYVRLLEIVTLRDQVYFDPHPGELALRNRG